MTRLVCLLWILGGIIYQAISQESDEGAKNVNNGVNMVEKSRKLSLDKDLFTGENVRTTDGIVPRVSCPIGSYRDTAGDNLAPEVGVRQDGCQPCRRGFFGSAEGLTASTCSGPCPAGRFSNRLGLTAADQCKKCPRGRYAPANAAGITKCNGVCRDQEFTRTEGNQASSACIECPPGFRGWQCKWAIQPRYGADHDGLSESHDDDGS